MDGKPTKKPEKMQNQAVLYDMKKDRGDSFKKQDSTKSKISDLVSTKLGRKPPLTDQGDVPIINKNTSTSKTNKITTDKVKKQIEIKPKLIADSFPKFNTAVEKKFGKTSEISNTVVNKTRVGERNASDKISLRSKVSNNQSQGKDTNKNSVKSDLKTDRIKPEPTDKSGSKEVIANSNKTPNAKSDMDTIKKEKDKDTTSHRKPMIKTIKSKNDKVYKAVTFTEQKRTKPTKLEINMPNIQAKKKPKLVDKNLEVKIASAPVTNNKSTSKLCFKENSQHRRNRLTERIKRKRLNRCISSPDKFKKAESPPTEVAKWAPSCVNAHTKPYYEAWVNTTLAAISKISNKDKLYLEKKNIIKTFQKSLELREQSPDLVHENFTDESYTGRIKIKQKVLPRRTRQPLITPLLDKQYSF